jgi:hypothetical protein
MSVALKLRRALPVTLAVLTFAWLTPAIDRANATPNNGGRGKVTCQGGAEPGDIQTIHTYTYVNGNLAGQTTLRQICGEDGQWHQIKEIVLAPSRLLHGTTQATLKLHRTTQATLKPIG